MREFVGIKSPFDLVLEVVSGQFPVENIFKREALMFDRVGCLQRVEQFLSLLGMIGNLLKTENPNITVPHELADHLTYLNERGLIFDVPPSADGANLKILESDKEFLSLRNNEQPIEQWLVESFQSAGLGELLNKTSIPPSEMGSYSSKMGPLIAPLLYALQYKIRRTSVELRVLNEMDAYPILSDIVPQLPFSQNEKCRVIGVVIKALPIPDESVPWEQIWEYRSDPDSQA
jgi:hypothetical protein